MRTFRLHGFGLEHLRQEDLSQPGPPQPGEVLVEPRALSLNFRDLLVIRGLYNAKLALPCVPISDAAGVVTAVGPDVTRLRVGDRVMTHYVAAWMDGPFRSEYLRTTLGTPGPGLAAERVLLPEQAVLPLPAGYDFAQAATLPIAALTAWSGLVTEGKVSAGQNVLTLGTGGVSIFAVQIAKALGARVIITSSSDEKLARAKGLGADDGVNYRTRPDWDKAVLELTGGLGADVTIENGGVGTVGRSLAATRAGGVVAMLGALTGLEGSVPLGLVLMRRLRVHGILVDSRSAFEALIRFIEHHKLEPVIDRRFRFEELPAALRYLESGGHMGKIVIEM